MATTSEKKLARLLTCIIEGVCKPVASSPLHAKLQILLQEVLNLRISVIGEK
jgi:hypothetical protein